MHRRNVFDQVFTVETAIAAAVFATVLGALLFAVVWRRASRPGVRASQRADRLGVEWFYVGALVAVAAFLVGYTALANRDSNRHDDAPAEVAVEVSAFQWCWEFRHPRPHAPDATVRANCRGGGLPTLVVPTGRTVRIELTSRDVIHSLWVPELRYKLDAFPDHRNHVTLRIDETGRWIGRCAEYCGELHHVMDFWLEAVPPDEYETWLAEHAAPAGAAA